VWSHLVRGLMTGFGVRGWPRRLRQATAGGRERASTWVVEAVTRWEAEGRISPDEARALRLQIAEPAFQAVLPHLGAHLGISVFLRFPFGSITRVTWTAGSLLTATGQRLLGRIDRETWRTATVVHSPLVIVLAALPSVGAFAYLASRPVRRNRLLLRVTADAALQHLPWHVYRRSRLDRLICRRVGIRLQHTLAP
jgi:hypothetical protein